MMVNSFTSPALFVSSIAPFYASFRWTPCAPDLAVFAFVFLSGDVSVGLQHVSSYFCLMRSMLYFVCWVLFLIIWSIFLEYSFTLAVDMDVRDIKIDNMDRWAYLYQSGHHLLIAGHASGAPFEVNFWPIFIKIWHLVKKCRVRTDFGFWGLRVSTLFIGKICRFICWCCRGDNISTDAACLWICLR